MDELQQIVENRNRDAVAPKQKELLQYVGGLVSKQQAFQVFIHVDIIWFVNWLSEVVSIGGRAALS